MGDRDGGVTKRLYHNGEWTKAKFTAWMKNILRRGSYRWPPRYEALKAAKVERGVYMCRGYKKRAHRVAYRDIQIDHIMPVVDPATGHTTWDKYINRLYCEVSNLQVLCKPCHKLKSKEERKKL